MDMVLRIMAVVLLSHASFYRHDSDAAAGVRIPLVPSVSSFTDRTVLGTIRSAARHSLSRAGDSSRLAATNFVNPSYGFTITAEVDTPSTEVKLFVDTGAQITTLLCDSTCPGCYPSGRPSFHPGSSFQMLTSCDRSRCDGLRLPPPCGENASICEYNMRLGYRDKNTSSMLGTVAFGILAAGAKTLKVAKAFIGCAMTDPGSLPGDASGVLALGQHDNSFISTYAQGANILPVFSTCVGGPLDSRPGVLVVGEDLVTTSTPDVVTVPLKSTTGYDARYVVPLRAIALLNEVFVNEPRGGDLVIDSGTPFFLLGSSMYDPFVNALDGYFGTPPKLLPDPTANTTLRCYSGVASNVPLPKVRLGFDQGRIELQKSGLFLDDAANNVTCLAILRATANYSVFGSFAQANIRVQYHLKTQLMSFFPYNCTVA